MADIKAGITGAVATVIVVILELILFPIGLSFLGSLNTSSALSATDKAMLSNVPTFFVVMVIFTVLGGMIASVVMATKNA